MRGFANFDNGTVTVARFRGNQRIVDTVDTTDMTDAPRWLRAVATRVVERGPGLYRVTVTSDRRHVFGTVGTKIDRVREADRLATRLARGYNVARTAMPGIAGVWQRTLASTEAVRNRESETGRMVEWLRSWT